MRDQGYVDIILGLIFGDEGKGKIVDALAPNYDIIARYNGTNNAGHTIGYKGQLIATHIIPSGIFHKGKLAVIGNGVSIPPYDFLREINELKKAGVEISENNLRVSDKASITMPHHPIIDYLEDLIRQLDTTGRGAGPSFTAKTSRDAITTKDLLDKDKLKKFYENNAGMINNHIEYLINMKLSPGSSEKRNKCLEDKLRVDCYYTIGKGLNVDAIVDSYHSAGMEMKHYMDDTVALLRYNLERGNNILAEGAQAAGLDIDHGTYPYVTSSHCSSAGAITGLGIPFRAIRDVTGVIKAVESRVGDGPFDTEIVSYSTLISLFREGKLKRLFYDGMSDKDRSLAKEKMQDLQDKMNYGDPTNFDQYQYFANLPPGEYGASTGRPRAVGWLNLPQIEHHAYLNGVNKLALTKLDSYVDIANFPVCIDYMNGQPVYNNVIGYSDVNEARKFSQLPIEAQYFVRLIEEKTNLPVSIISVGPSDKETIFRN